MKNILAFIITVYIATFTHFAPAGTTVPDSANITVISALNNNANLIYVGYTMFENDYKSVVVADWAIDERITSKLLSTISQLNRYNIIRIDLDESLAKTIDIERNAFSADRVNAQSLDAIKALNTKHGVDFVEPISNLIFSVYTSLSPFSNAHLLLVNCAFRKAPASSKQKISNPEIGSSYYYTNAGTPILSTCG